MASQEEKEDRKIRKVNAALGVLGVAGTAAGVYGGSKLRKTLKGLPGDLAKAARKESGFDYTPFARSPEAKAKRRVARQRSKRANKLILSREKRSWPKWRKALNKLPGGKTRLFDNPLIQRSEELRYAKNLAQGLIMLEHEPDPVRVARDIQRINRKVSKNVRHGRQGVEAVRDIKDAIKGERRNKRRKRFYEKQHFKDKAMATAITAGLGGAALLAGSKRGRKLLGEMEAREDLPIEFAHAGWHTTRPTAGSVRVHHVGYKRRNRRGKYWHERKKNRDKALMATTGLAGAATIFGILRGRKAGKVLKKLKVSEGRRKMLSGKVNAVKNAIKPHANSPAPNKQGQRILDAMEKVGKDYKISKTKKAK